METFWWACKILLNILVFCIYVVIALITLWMFLQLIGIPVSVGSMRTELMWWFTAVSVLIITILFRKFFYFSTERTKKTKI